MRTWHRFLLLLCLMVTLGSGVNIGYGQAALLLQDAEGAAAVLSPLGHEAVYFARICAASPTKLRHCDKGESGAVISRYHGISGYDWLAVPLIPYLYAVDDVSVIPAQVTQKRLQQMRLAYYEEHRTGWGPVSNEGAGMQRGWNQLLGAAYMRRIYVVRFDTTEAQDDAFITRMNASENRSHFNILFENCANFSASVLDFYLPSRFGRRKLTELGLVTPRQVAYELVQYAKRHPQLNLSIFEVSLVRGYRERSRVSKGVAGSLVGSGYILPIAALNPYVAGVILADSLIWGRYPLPLKDAQPLTAADLSLLGSSADEEAMTMSAPSTFQINRNFAVR